MKHSPSQLVVITLCKNTRGLGSAELIHSQGVEVSDGSMGGDHVSNALLEVPVCVCVCGQREFVSDSDQASTTHQTLPTEYLPYWQ